MDKKKDCENLQHTPITRNRKKLDTTSSKFGSSSRPQELRVGKTLDLSTPELRSRTRQLNSTSSNKNYRIKICSPSRSDSKESVRGNTETDTFGRPLRVFTEDHKKGIIQDKKSAYKHGFSSGKTSAKIDPKSQLKSKIKPKLSRRKASKNN